MCVVSVLRLVSLHFRQSLVEKVPTSVHAWVRRVRRRVQNENGGRIVQIRQSILITAKGSIQDVKRRVRYDHLDCADGNVASKNHRAKSRLCASRMRIGMKGQLDCYKGMQPMGVRIQLDQSSSLIGAVAHTNAQKEALKRK